MKKNLIIYLMIAAILLYQFAQLALALYNSYFTSEHISVHSNIDYVFSVIVHLILALLVLTQIYNLEEYGVDKFTIVTFLLFSMLRPMQGFIGENFLLLLIALISLTTITVLLAKKPKLLQTKLYFCFIGIITGALLLILLLGLELILGFVTWPLVSPSGNQIISSLVSLVVREFSSGALLEEMLFRGFLWGLLRRHGLMEKKIFWIQFILFWLAHVGHAPTVPFTFFIAVPLLSFLSSQLTLRSKQIFPSILSHSVINIVSAMLNLATH